MQSEPKERPVNTFDPSDFEKKLEHARKTNWLETDEIKWFQDNGWNVCYHKGLVDKTSQYTRYEEDSIVMKNNMYIIQVNIPSATTVLQLLKDNADFYGGKPTMFLTIDEIYYLSELVNHINIKVMDFDN